VVLTGWAAFQAGLIIGFWKNQGAATYRLRQVL